MSALRIISASFTSFCQNYQIWWKYDKVLTKQFCTVVFLIHGVCKQNSEAVLPCIKFAMPILILR